MAQLTTAGSYEPGVDDSTSQELFGPVAPVLEASSRSRFALGLQRTVGNSVAARTIQRRHAPAARQQPSSPNVQRLGLDDLVPDFVLNPIKSLAGQGSGFSSGLHSKSTAAASRAQSEAEAAASHVAGETSTQVGAERSRAEVAANRAHSHGVHAEATAHSARAAGERQAGQLQHALPAAEYATDPARPVVEAPPPSKLPGGVAAATKGPAETWNCDEAAILNQASTVGKGVIQGLTKVVKSIVPEDVLRFAQQSVAKVQSAVATIKQKVEAAKQVVAQWIDAKLKPIRDGIQKVEQAVAEKFNAARRAVAEKVSQAGAWAAAKWTALRGKVSTAVTGAVAWAKNGVGGLVDKAKSLAGRFWKMLPDWIKAGLTGAAIALAAPVIIAYKVIETAGGWIERKAAAVREKLARLADQATRWLAEKYQKARAVVVRVGSAVGRGIDWVKKTAGEVGRAVYHRIDQLSGGRISKLRAAAARRLAEVRGEVCAVTGAAAGPCVERFLPEPVGQGKSFATLSTKADATVPVEGVPVKIAAGATITIERTAAQYTAVLSGEGFAGVALNLSGGGGGGGGGGSGSVAVDGTLPNRALGLLSLNGQGPGLPGVPIPIGGGGKPATGGTVPAAPGGGRAAPAASGGPRGPATGAGSGAGGGGGGGFGGGGSISASAEVGKKVGVALTYTFNAGRDKSPCDGLGGLTAFLATQGAATMLPAPFSSLAGAGGQAAFSDHLTSAKFTTADTGSVSLKGGGGGAELSAGLKAERGVSIEAKTEDDRSRSLTATLFQGVTGEAALNFAPEGIGLGSIGGSLGGRQELAIIYNLTQDKLDASFKQGLSGSATLGSFAAMVGRLPAVVREPIRARLRSLPDATEASVSFELSNNVKNLSALGRALDSELNKGSGASAVGVWNAVSAFVRNKDNCFTEFSAKLTLTEKVLGVKASVSTPEQVNVGAELGVTRGQEIILVPATKL